VQYRLTLAELQIFCFVLQFADLLCVKMPQSTIFVLARSSKTLEEAHEHHVCECARLYRRYWTCRDALPRISHVSFLDPSGGAADSFTCAIAYNDNNAAVLDRLVEIKAPFNPDSATIDLAATLKS